MRWNLQGLKEKKSLHNNNNNNNIFFLIRLNLEIQLTIKMSEKTERRFGVILAPFSSKEWNRKDNLYVK